MSGLNVSYKRALLDSVSGVFEDGFYETFANGTLKKRGFAILMHPGAIVFHNKQYIAKGAAEDCFHLARLFAAQRARRFGIGKRALLRSLPYVFLLMTFWSGGELAGYLAGKWESDKRWS